MKPYLLEYKDTENQSLLENILYPVRTLNHKRLEQTIEHKTILITGASFGIGAMLVEILSHFSITLLLIARTKEKLDQIAQNIGDKPAIIKIFCLDLKDEKQVNFFLQSERPKIDIFINNAGKSIYRSLIDSVNRFQDVQRCAAINYTAPTQLLLGILPDLLEKKGHIINISSINALLLPTVGWSAYQSSKVAFDQWLRCMMPELHIREVAVSSFYLPLVRTRMSMVNPVNHKRPAMSQAKTARLILRYIISRKSKYQPWWLYLITFLSPFLGNLWQYIQIKQLKSKFKKK